MGILSETRLDTYILFMSYMCVYRRAKKQDHSLPFAEPCDLSNIIFYNEQNPIIVPSI